MIDPLIVAVLKDPKRVMFVMHRTPLSDPQEGFQGQKWSLEIEVPVLAVWLQSILKTDIIKPIF